MMSFRDVIEYAIAFVLYALFCAWFANWLQPGIWSGHPASAMSAGTDETAQQAQGQRPASAARSEAKGDAQ